MSSRLLLLLLLPATAIATEEAIVTQLADQASARVPTNTIIPAYPEVARRNRVEGEVRVCFNVNRKGRPYRIAVRSSTNRVFEKPSMRAVRASRYAPIPDEREVPAVKTCRSFRFRLERVDEP